MLLFGENTDIYLGGKTMAICKICGKEISGNTNGICEDCLKLVDNSENISVYEDLSDDSYIWENYDNYSNSEYSLQKSSDGILYTDSGDINIVDDISNIIDDLSHDEDGSDFYNDIKGTSKKYRDFRFDIANNKKHSDDYSKLMEFYKDDIENGLYHIGLADEITEDTVIVDASRGVVIYE